MEFAQDPCLAPRVWSRLLGSRGLGFTLTVECALRRSTVETMAWTMKSPLSIAEMLMRELPEVKVTGHAGSSRVGRLGARGEGRHGCCTRCLSIRARLLWVPLRSLYSAPRIYFPRDPF